MRGMAYGGAWRPPGKASACCTRRMCWLYVKYGGAWRPPGKASACCTRRMCWLYVLVLCKVGCLGRTRCKRGVALVKFQTFPISYGVTGRIYWPTTKLKVILPWEKFPKLDFK